MKLEETEGPKLKTSMKKRGPTILTCVCYWSLAILYYSYLYSLLHISKTQFWISTKFFLSILQKFDDINFTIDTNKSLLQNNSILIPLNSIN